MLYPTLALDTSSLVSTSTSTLISTPLPASGMDAKLDLTETSAPVQIKVKPKLNLIINPTSITTAKIPTTGRLSSKGFIEPHRNHLPRRTTTTRTRTREGEMETNERISRERSKTAPLPGLELDASLGQEGGRTPATFPQTLELSPDPNNAPSKWGGIPLSSSPATNSVPSSTPPHPKMKPREVIQVKLGSMDAALRGKGYIQPHHSNLPRRARTRQRAKTVSHVIIASSTGDTNVNVTNWEATFNNHPDTKFEDGIRNRMLLRSAVPILHMPEKRLKSEEVKVDQGLASGSNIEQKTTSSTPSLDPLSPTDKDIDIMSKGYIQPHHSHLPRRLKAKRRAETVPTSIPAPTPTSPSMLKAKNVESTHGPIKSETHSTTMVVTPIAVASPQPLIDPYTLPEPKETGKRDDQERKASETLPMPEEPHPTSSPSSSSTSSKNRNTSSFPSSTTSALVTPPPLSVKIEESGMKTKGHIGPHRNHLPRRPTRPKTKDTPPPLPLSAINTDISHVIRPSESESYPFPSSPTPQRPLEEPEVALPEPTSPLGLGLNLGPSLSTTVAALISAAQNKQKALYEESDHLHGQEPTSPLLPHPAMGLTMGLMNAARDAVAAAAISGTNPNPTGTPGRIPASGVLPQTAPAAGMVPMGTPILNPSTALGVFGSPALQSGPLRTNLPRRHRRRWKEEEQGRGEGGGGGGGDNSRRESLTRGKGGDGVGMVLRFERVRVRDEGDGGVLNFESDSPAESDSSPFHRHLRQQRALSAPPKGPKHIKRSKSRCLQVLGNSRIELGFLRPNATDYVLVQVVDHQNPYSAGEEEEEEETVIYDKRTLKLALLDERMKACKEGVSSLTPAQIIEGCEFINSSLAERRNDRIRILCPRGRPEDAMALALCYLAWFEGRGGPSSQVIVPIGVNDIGSSRSGHSHQADGSTQGHHVVYSSIHLLYMRLLDDDDGSEWCKLGRRTNPDSPSSTSLIGLGIAGLDAIQSTDYENGESSMTTNNPHDNSAGQSRHHRRVVDAEVEEEEESMPKLLDMARGRTLTRHASFLHVKELKETMNRKGKKVLHVREAALGGRDASLSSPFSPLSASVVPTLTWKGLKDEWRGVLSVDGLDELIGVWP